MDSSTIGRKNYEIGSEFEKAVSELFVRMGYDIELNRKVAGRSSAEYEIDIYGEKKSWGKATTMAVECKHKDGQMEVQRDDVAVFNLKLDELGISEGYMVTNGRFSESAVRVASHYKIELVDGEELRRRFKQHGIPYTFENYESVLTGTIPDAVKSTLNLLNKLGILPDS